MEMTKKTCLIGVIGTAVVMLSACAQKGEQRTSGEDEKTDEVEVKTDIQSDDADEWADEDVLPDGKCLNDIRFENFEEKDWYDNEYFRALRQYLDGFNNGEIEDEQLELYRKDVQGKFAVFCAQPYVGGGMLIELVFIDHPQKMFWAWVYSDVDIRTETIMGYRVFSISEHGNNDCTREEILQILREHPENKLW